MVCVFTGGGVFLLPACMPPGGPNLRREFVVHAARRCYPGPAGSSSLDMANIPVTEPAPAEASQVLNEEFEEFVRGSLKRLLGRAVWLCRQRHLAEDLVQETYLRLWKAWLVRADTITDKSAYANMILTNVYRDFYRQKRAEESSEIVPEIPVGLGEEKDVRLDTLQCAINELPPQQREVIYLHYYEGHSLADTAAAMGIAAKTAHNYHTLAKNRLRELCARDPVTATGRSDPAEMESW